MSEILAREQVAACSPWQAPPVGARHKDTAPSAREIEALHRRAREEGFSQGRAEGLADAREELAARAASLDSLLEALAEPLAEIDEEVVHELVVLATAVARRLVRRELRADPGQIVAVVREALSVLPLTLREIRVHMHPDDARLVEEVLPPAEHGEGKWQIVEDPVLTRGGCRITSPSSQVDATLETRLGQVINAVLGGERDGEGKTDA